MYPDEHLSLTVSVRTLAESLARRGDIDFRFTSRFGLEEGAKGHRRLQAIFPDLFWLGVQGDYEFIEVKGPGDRLQKHQSRWLSFFVEQGIPCRVVYVSR